MGVVQISKEEILLFGGESVGSEMNQSLIFNAKQKKFEVTEDVKQKDIFLGEHPKVISNVYMCLDVDMVNCIYSISVLSNGR